MFLQEHLLSAPGLAFDVLEFEKCSCRNTVENSNAGEWIDEVRRSGFAAIPTLLIIICPRRPSVATIA